MKFPLNFKSSDPLSLLIPQEPSVSHYLSFRSNPQELENVQLRLHCLIEVFYRLPYDVDNLTLNLRSTTAPISKSSVVVFYIGLSKSDRLPVSYINYHFLFFRFSTKYSRCVTCPIVL